MSEEEEDEKKILCEFCLGKDFTIHPFVDIPRSQQLSEVHHDRLGLLGLRIPVNRRHQCKRYNHPSLKYLIGSSRLHKQRGRKALTLQELLNIIQQVWRNPNSPPSLDNSSPIMDDRVRKTSSSVSSDIPSPILLRRRLSAPETVMRKYVLARAQSQESDLTQVSDSRSCQYPYEVGIGSDPNLNKKRDSSVVMRKSTLLRRLMSNNKSSPSSTFHEWQHSYGKLSTHSLTSLQSSPEHLSKSQSRRSLTGYEFRTSPQHSYASRKISPSHQVHDPNRPPVNTTVNSSPKRKISLYHGSFTNPNHNSCCSSCISSRANPTENRPTGTNTTNMITTIENDSEIPSTRSTNTSSDRSDSAYTNSHSKFSRISSTTTSNQSIEIPQQPTIAHKSSQKNDINENYQNVDETRVDPNRNSTENTTNINYSTINESSTQTNDTTNLNVISNVQLSQSTLDLIVNQVMQDVHNTFHKDNDTSVSNVQKSIHINGNQPNIIQVQQMPSFYLKQKEVVDKPINKIVKYMISNVEAGSPYKPTDDDKLTIPRYSALPRSSSMEVNTSGNGTDNDNSDNVSLVDSLDDTDSIRTTNSKNFDEKPVRGDLSLFLPDNSDKILNPINKATAFFIPMEVNNQLENKPVAELLPEKVKHKLSERNQRLQKKANHSDPTKFETIRTKVSETEKQAPHLSNKVNSHFNFSTFRKKTSKRKPFLPNIETMRKIKISDSSSGKSEMKNKSLKRKLVSKEHVAASSNSKPVGNTSTKEPEQSIYSTHNEYVYDNGPHRIYHKTEFSNSNKRIEILEIMECVDTSERTQYRTPRGRSKIPVLVSQKYSKLPDIHPRNIKPTYLDLDEISPTDPKLDQLIANILIQTLNDNNQEMNEDKVILTKDTKKDDNAKVSSPTKHVNKFQQIFDAIPEELSQQSSNDEPNNLLAQLNNANNNSIDNRSSVEEIAKNNNTDIDKTSKSNGNDENCDSYKGKAAVAVVRDENVSTIPKGWITFYMLQKNQGSPESTSDEGRIPDKATLTLESKEQCIKTAEKDAIFEEIEHLAKSVLGTAKKDCHSEDKMVSSSSDRNLKNVTVPPVSTKKFNNSHRKHRYRNSSTGPTSQAPPGEWSITLTGTNTSSFAPDLEMRFRFPNSNKTNNAPSQSDSGLGEDNQPHETKSSLPRINDKYSQTFHGTESRKPTDDQSEREGRIQHLPEINKNKTQRKQKRCDSSVSSDAISSFRMEPRQTRTSTRRYNMTRPKMYSLPDTNAIDLIAERQYVELIRRLPQILVVSGNSISPERKPQVPAVSEKDVTKNYYSGPH